MLAFDEATHTYRWDGKVVPGVTGVLAPLTDFDSVPRDILNAGSEFGRAVHRACELDDLGELDEEQLDPALRPYLEAWRQFSGDHQVSWRVIEQPLFHSTLSYAGTPDRDGVVDGVNTVVDIKSTAELYPQVGPQLAAYANLIDPKFGFARRRMAVQLKGDGTYTAKVYSDPTDWPTFVSLLTLRTWCARHSITPKFKA